MNIFPKAAAFAAAALLLSVGACGDGATTTDDTNTDDTATAGDTAEASDSGETGDTGEASDTTDPGDTAQSEDTTPAADTTPPPTNACTYQYDEMGSYVKSLAVANVDDDVDCCFDYDGDNVIDNQLGSIIKSIQSLPAFERKVNEVLAANIADGTIVVLMEFPGLTNVASTPDVTMNGFYGVDGDDDLTNNPTGHSTFYGNRSSFVNDTTQPIISLTGTKITANQLVAGPGLFRLVIPLVGGLVIDADINQARFEGTTSVGPGGGMAIADGKLGGVISQDDLFGAINQFFDGSCSCLDTGGQDILRQNGSGVWSCLPASDIDSSACDTSEGSFEANCGTVAGACGVALLLVSPDIDTTDDGKKDSLSLGFWYSATGADIIGTDPEDCD